ncbi:4-hydroxythreonine-4-phosphate dehydrogenase PdxA [Pseudoramibacter alactolyticus]|jgi:4-hydroxythreonine-4-phosphate dehydrogenase|uniref:4-hydroxythreonine-4-phosphate dehydrogenase PdxA n=1 Tax=Pseudoramibacter alactolyticus TaxID=113287 RepID=UPI0028E646B7|nr:4-hydroxythreonine-4-phosphate dehydrogenase PdxA [Pseudoramibacter alactolyticus]
MKPKIAIPIGDPAGIGPEISVKALKNKQVYERAICIAIGDKQIIENAMKIVGSFQKLHIIENPKEAVDDGNILNVINISNIDMEKFSFGKVNPMCGRAAYEYIEQAIKLAMDREVDAVTTTTINKEAIKLAGVPYIGHTEIFGALTGTEDPLTLFEVQRMRILFLSRHVSLRQACDMVTKSRIKDYVKRGIAVLKQLGLENPSMAVAGLNPHCGEHGILGTEEQTDIIPAVQELKEEGYNVCGPIGADSIFHQALEGRFDSVLSLYHDQGHVAAKTLDFDRTVSITGGMPILRTSVDHGTAFDIAGKGIASEVSLVETIKVASKYAPSFVG